MAAPWKAVSGSSQGSGAKATVRKPSLIVEGNISGLGPRLSYNITLVIRELYHSYGTPGPPIKEPLPLRQRTLDQDPLPHVN
jgi:hypothetical protein